MKSAKKVLVGLSLLLMLGAKSGRAQTVSTKAKKQDKIENTTDQEKSDGKFVKFADAKRSVYAEFAAFSYATPGMAKLIWSPVVILTPSVTFGEKLSAGVTTTQMLQNYTGDNATTIMHDLYAHAELKLKNMEVFTKVGYFSALNYAGPYASCMPYSYFFQNAIRLHSGHYMPSAVITGVRNKNFAAGCGYAEFGQKFKFTGNGDFIAVGEVFFNKLKIGTLWILNDNKHIGDLQLTYNPNANNSVLVELIGIGDKDFGVHATYVLNMTETAKLFVNAYTQNSTGMAGANVGVGHSPSGVYLVLGGTYRDALLANTENYDKLAPMLELGIRRNVFPTK